MKYLKMFSLAAVAAVAAMAFIGAGTASATRICSTNTLPCGSILGSGTPIKAELTGGNEAVLTSGFAVVKCKTSVISGETTSAGGGAGVAVLGTITSASWSNCACNLGGTVTTAAENLPWSAELNWTSEMNGTMKVANPQGSFVCAGTKCIYGATSVSTTVTGGAPAIVTASVTLERKAGSGALCSATATWKGTYTVTSPNPLWVSEA
jgi:hypothetical protein